MKEYQTIKQSESDGFDVFAPEVEFTEGMNSAQLAAFLLVNAVNGTTEQAKRDMAEFMIAALSAAVDVFEKQEGKRNV